VTNWQLAGTQIAAGEADIEAEWAARSRGSRNISPRLDFEDRGDTLTQDPGIDRWEER